MRDAINTRTIVLDNGMTVTYPATRIGEYLKALYVDLFHPSRKIGGVLEALTGRNVRSALKMFTDIIISGHLDERSIVSTVEGAKQFGMAEATIIKILMRTGYKYHADDHGYVTNILNFKQDWQRPNNFIMIECLGYLQRKRKDPGEIGIEGYFSVRTIANEMARLGFVEDDVVAALAYLLERGLVQADHMRSSGLEGEDLVKLHASGYMHIHIFLERLEYLAGVLPSTEVFRRDVAVKLGELWDIPGNSNDIGVRRKGEALVVFRAYLREEFNRLCDSNAFFDRYSQASQTCLRKLDGALEFLERTVEASGRPAGSDDWVAGLKEDESEWGNEVK